MDWGFSSVEAADGTVSRIACFSMACHHCGMPYIEFFPNARQENLFIGMLHGFMELGIPERVLTDNMKSVVVRRNAEGNPIWQRDYEAFMDSTGFHTRLCQAQASMDEGQGGAAHTVREGELPPGQGVHRHNPAQRGGAPVVPGAVGQIPPCSRMRARRRAQGRPFTFT